MELDKEINWLLKEQPLWMKAKLSMKEKIEIAELLQRYTEQLNKPCVSNNEVAVCTHQQRRWVDYDSGKKRWICIECGDGMQTDC